MLQGKALLGFRLSLARLPPLTLVRRPSSRARQHWSASRLPLLTLVRRPAAHARDTIGLQASVDAGADAADDGMALMPVRYVKDAQTAYPTGDPNFAVKQSFPSVVGERESDPFLMCDEFGPTVSRRAYGNDTDAGFDVPWHPRRAAPRRCSRDPGWARDERTSPSCSVGTMAWIF